MTEPSPRTAHPPAAPGSDSPLPAPAARQWQNLTTWLILGLAAGLRLLWLGMKPPHFDEGVNGWFVDQMTRTGFYHYDPGNYHGPFHFYILFLAQTLFGRSIVVFRLPLVLINLATVWLVLQYRRFLPWRVCALAALAFAISPGMVFYSRYAIHEAWLVFAMVLGVWGVAELWTRGSARGLWAAGMGVTLMILTKETYVIHLVAFGLAAITLWGLERFSPSAPGMDVAAPRQWTRRMLWDVAAMGALALLFFYSGGFLDFSSLAGLGQTLAIWTHTGMAGSGHSKEWDYWLRLLCRYEWPALLGIAFSLRALWPGMNRLSRLLAIYGCGTLTAYSLVSYKTPWCIISILWPFFFLFGEAVETALRLRDRLPRRFARAGTATVAAIATALLGVSAWITVRLNFFHPTDPKERYVYVQTTDDFFKLTRPLEWLVAQDPAAYHLRGWLALSNSGCHPLPWVLGDFTDIEYSGEELPAEMDAAFLVVEQTRIAEVEARLRRRYFSEPFQLRDGLAAGRLYFDAERFAPFFPDRTPEFVPQPVDTTDAANTDANADANLLR